MWARTHTLTRLANIRPPEKRNSILKIYYFSRWRDRALRSFNKYLLNVAIRGPRRLKGQGARLWVWRKYDTQRRVPFSCTFAAIRGDRPLSSKLPSLSWPRGDLEVEPECPTEMPQSLNFLNSLHLSKMVTLFLKGQMPDWGVLLVTEISCIF